MGVVNVAHGAPFGNRQLNIRTGIIQGSYANPAESAAGGGQIQDNLEGGGFSVVPSLDLTYEVFSESKRSYGVRGTIAMDSATGVMHYNYFGLTKKHYFKGAGLPLITASPEVEFTLIPKSRQYYGFDFGMSRVSVVSFGPALESVSTGIDIGAHWGYIKQMGKSWGLNVELGGSYAYGISTVSTSGMNIKILFGVSLTP
jgi:hypothetical protein